MKAFLGGLIVGGAAVALAYSYLPEPPAVNTKPSVVGAKQVPENTAEETAEADFSKLAPYLRHNAISPGYTYSLGQAFDENSQTPLQKFDLTVTEHAVVLAFAPDDVARVCLQPVMEAGTDTLAHFYVYSFLTPTARQKLAQSLDGYDGKHMSFEFMGREMASFIQQKERRETYASRTDDEPDFEVGIPLVSTLSGLLLAHNLAWPGQLEMCQSTDSTDIIPHYDEFTKMAEDAIAVQRTPNEGLE